MPLPFATTASADDLQFIHGLWSWPDQGLSLNPEGDLLEGALGYDLLPYQGKLVVAGGFLYAGGIPANCLAVWDGQTWSTLGGASPSSAVHSLLELDGSLYIGGNFGSVGGVTAKRVAKWDGETWSGLGNGLIASVTSLAAWDDGHGSILYAGTSDWERLARWDGLAWTGIPGVSGAVTSLAVFDDGTGPALYMGGEFTEVDGIPITNIARWNGQSWSSVGDPHLFPQDVVYPLRVLDDGSGPALFAGQVLQKWDGQVWTRYAPQPGAPGGLAMYPGPDGRPTLHMAGMINLGDNQNPRYTNIARFTPGFACGDFNQDGVVDQQDLGILLSSYDCDGPNCQGDADGDGDTDQADLGILLKFYG